MKLLAALRRSKPSPAAEPAAPLARSPYRSGGSGGPLERYRAVLDRLPFPDVRTAPGAHLPVRLLPDTAPVGPPSHRVKAAVDIAAVSLFVLVASLTRPGGVSLLATLGLALGASMVWWSLVGHLRLARRDLAIELAEEPLFLGAPLRGQLVLRGPRRVRRARVTLVCEERVQYQSGSDPESETHLLSERVLLVAEDLDIARESAWSQEITADLPEQAMHSFLSASNEIRWTLLVDIQPERGPKVTLAYPVRVLPPA
ncbi:hypothetical protein AB3662_12035 [Sorangium cellulosum]|uniref:hypothetical protein n=1 Tax=Sorangium cellulosum TaxID=56 RepID=UPI003D9A806E